MALEYFNVGWVFTAIFLGLFFHFKLELSKGNPLVERKHIPQDLKMEGLLWNFWILEQNIRRQDFVRLFVDRFHFGMCQYLENVVQRGRISFLNLLLWDSQVQVDFLGACDVKAGEDGDEDILGIVFLKVFIPQASASSDKLHFEIGIARLLGWWRIVVSHYFLQVICNEDNIQSMNNKCLN